MPDDGDLAVQRNCTAHHGEEEGIARGSVGGEVGLAEPAARGRPAAHPGAHDRRWPPVLRGSPPWSRPSSSMTCARRRT